MQKHLPLFLDLSIVFEIGHRHFSYNIMIKNDETFRDAQD